MKCFIQRMWNMDATAWATWASVFVTVIMVVIIWRQAGLLRRQLELQVLTDLFKEWNSSEMEKKRANWANTDNNNVSLDELNKVEHVLEFLERVASFSQKKILTQHSVWDNFGWYILRYYFYNRNNINNIQDMWGKDQTLYMDIKTLFEELLKKETKVRKKSQKEIEELLDSEEANFRKSERG